VPREVLSGFSITVCQLVLHIFAVYASLPFATEARAGDTPLFISVLSLIYTELHFFRRILSFRSLSFDGAPADIDFIALHCIFHAGIRHIISAIFMFQFHIITGTLPASTLSSITVYAAIADYDGHFILPLCPCHRLSPPAFWRAYISIDADGSCLRMVAWRR